MRVSLYLHSYQCMHKKVIHEIQMLELKALIANMDKNSQGLYGIANCNKLGF